MNVALTMRRWIFVVVPAIVGVSLLTLGNGWLRDERAFDARSREVTGEVVGQLETPNGLFRPIIRFEDPGGQTHEFTDETAGGKDSYPVGAEVPVRVPEDPTQAVLDDGFMRKGFPGLFAGAGALTLVFALLRLRIALRPQQ